MSDNENNPFEKGSKVTRTPTEKPQDTGYVSNFLNLSQNISTIEERRQSVSLNTPVSTSTFVDREQNIYNPSGAQPENSLIDFSPTIRKQGETPSLDLYRAA